MTAFDEVLADSLSRPVPEVKPRRTRIATAPGMASAVVGMRRSGKTCLLYGEMHGLLKTGIDRSRMLYVNFEDDRLHPLGEDVLQRTVDWFYRLSTAPRGEKAYFFLDEVQAVEGWARVARRLLDTENVSLFVTGSSAKMLSREVSTEFRGRGLTTELLPLGFDETLDWDDIAIPGGMTGARERSVMERSLAVYLRRGGFPAVQGLPEQQRVQILQSYVDLVILRDVIERHGLGNPHAVRTFTLSLLQASGSLASVNKLYRDLRSRGVQVGKDTLYGLLDHLEDSFLLFTVPVFDRSLRVRQTNPRKVYAVDPGLSFAFSPAGSRDTGRHLEEAVYLHLRRSTPDARPGAICYYRTKDDREVDFVCGDPDIGNPRELVQVCADLSDDATRERELTALATAMEELDHETGTLVTMLESGTIRLPGDREMILVPAWRWFLGD